MWNCRGIGNALVMRALRVLIRCQSLDKSTYKNKKKTTDASIEVKGV